MRLGDSKPLLGANLILALSAVFAAHLAVHTTRSLVFGKIDVSEAQWSIIAIHMVSAIGGPDVWTTQLLSMSFTVGEIVCIASATALFIGIFGNMSIALGLAVTPLEAHGIKIPRRRFPPVPFLLTPLLIRG